MFVSEEKLTVQKQIQPFVVSGQIISISDRIITLKTTKSTLSIPIEKNAEIYLFNLRTKEQKGIDFNEIKIGENADVYVEKEGETLTGVKIIVLSR